jgi:hypothetical protein
MRRLSKAEPCPAGVSNIQLLRVLRMVIRADSDPARQALFATLLRAHFSVRLAYRLHRLLRGTWGSTLLIGVFGAASFLSVGSAANRAARVLAVARHENARRHVDRVFAWIGPEHCDLLPTRVRDLVGLSVLSRMAALLSSPRRLVTALRVIRRIDRRYGFLVSSRASAALAWYARATAILRDCRPDAVLVSSDSNPEEVGFAAAARAFGIPQVFVSHAYPTPLSPPLDFSLSILEGEAAVAARERKGPIKGAVLLAGIEGDSAPLDPRRFERANPVIGIFTSKALSWPTLAAVVEDCRRHLHSRQIVIRWHPSMLERPRLAEVLDDVSDIVETPRSAALADVAQLCDWVIADENSNVHLPVLKMGVPTVAVKRLGVYPASRADQYGFVDGGIVFPPFESIRDLRADTLIAFFSGGWRTRFAQYDASYLRPREAVGTDVRNAIYGLFEQAAVQPVP